MFFREPSGLFAPAQRAANPLYFVRHYLFPIAASTENDSGISFMGRHSFGYRSNEFRIVD